MHCMHMPVLDALACMRGTNCNDSRACHIRQTRHTFSRVVHACSSSHSEHLHAQPLPVACIARAQHNQVRPALRLAGLPLHHRPAQAAQSLTPCLSDLVHIRMARCAAVRRHLLGFNPSRHNTQNKAGASALAHSTGASERGTCWLPSWQLPQGCTSAPPAPACMLWQTCLRPRWCPPP